MKTLKLPWLSAVSLSLLLCLLFMTSNQVWFHSALDLTPDPQRNKPLAQPAIDNQPQPQHQAAPTTRAPRITTPQQSQPLTAGRASEPAQGSEQNAAYRVPSHQQRPPRQEAWRELKRFDQPDDAHRFYLLKRVPEGASSLPVERYLAALEQIKEMPQHFTPLNTLLPSRNALGPAAAELSSLGTWTQLGPGNIGGRTRALLIAPSNPNTMYAAGVAGGVWKTTNGGGTWTPLADLMANLAVNALAMDPTNPNVIYAGTGEGYFNFGAVRGAGIFKTTDGGTNWSHLASTNNSNFHYVNDLVISPTNSQRLYAATQSGVWRSTDGGTNWTRVFNPGLTCLDLAIRTDQATDYLLVSVGAFSQATIYRNTDAGGSGVWAAVLTESGMGRTALALAPSNQNVIYALASSIANGDYHFGLHAVFRSLDGGSSWTAQVRNTSPTVLNRVLLTNPLYALCGSNQFFNQGWYDNVIAVDPADPNRVWAGGIDLFRSDDGGQNWGLASHWWAATSNPRYAHADQHVIVFHPQYNGTTNRVMFVGNDGGIFRTNDAHAAVATGPNASCNTSNGSVTWTALNKNYGVTQFYHGAPYPNGTTFFGGTQDNGTVRGTEAGGINGWEKLLGGDGGYVAVDPTDTNILYAEFQYLAIQKSVNGGASWFPATNGIVNSGFLFIVPFIMDPSNAQRLWTGGVHLWRTTDGAANWTQASASLASAVSAIAVAPTDGNFVLAGTYAGEIYQTNIGLSSDSTTVWPVVTPRGGWVSWLTFDPTDANIAYATYSTFGGTHVWKSTDAGATWTGIDGAGATGLPDIPVHCLVVDPTNTARLYIGTDLGVFVSTDGGASWAVENTGFANVVTESLALTLVDGVLRLFAFTHGRGAWRVEVVNTGCLYTITPTSASFETLGGTGSVTVSTQSSCTWTASSNASWITITSGSSDTGSGTVSYSVGANPGAARSGTLTIAGQTFTVSQAGSSTYTLTASPSTVAPGATLTVNWMAPSGRPATDWIGLYRVGDPNTSYLWWSYTQGATQGSFTLTAPSQAGKYEFRYLQNNGYTDVARSNVVTVSQPTGYTLTASPSTVGPGGTLTVNWTAPSGRPAVDWIGLYRVGDPNTNYLWWSYTQGATQGSFTLSAPSQAEQYEFRYLQNNGYTDVARSNVVTVQ
jgi:photosystem II stability/assembly factor-like uncharacterized protein